MRSCRFGGPVSLSPERARRIGGSDVAAIFAVSPWQSEFDLWLRVTQGYAPDDSDDATRAGQRFERLLRDEYAARTGLDVRDVMPGHRDWRAWSLDGAVFDGGCVLGIVEVKCPGFAQRGEWGEDGAVYASVEDAVAAGGIPAHYALQAAWYMGLGGGKWCDFVVGFRGGIDGLSRPIVVRVMHNDEQYGAVLERVEAWHERHVVGNAAPDMGASPSAAAWLSKRNAGNAIVRRPATDAEAALMARSFDLARRIGDLEAERRGVNNRLRESMGDAVSVWGGGYSCTLPVSKSGGTRPLTIRQEAK